MMLVLWPKSRRVRNGIVLDFDARTIYHRGLTWKTLGPDNKRFQLVCFLIVKKLTACDLFRLLYEHDAEGGPLTGENIIYVMLYQLRTTLQKLGLKWHTDRMAPRDVRYRQMWISPK